jgi:hypothetical protein
MNQTVYQVRAIDVRGVVRIVHAYETQELAEAAVDMMKEFNRIRYTIVPVPNDPTQFWGVDDLPIDS